MRDIEHIPLSEIEDALFVEFKYHLPDLPDDKLRTLARSVREILDRLRRQGK